MRWTARPADADRLHRMVRHRRGMSSAPPIRCLPAPAAGPPRVRVMPAAGSAAHGPGRPGRVRRASCPPSGPLRPRTIAGGARGPEEQSGGSLRARFVFVPPRPGGERGELRRKVPPLARASGPAGRGLAAGSSRASPRRRPAPPLALLRRPWPAAIDCIYAMINSHCNSGQHNAKKHAGKSRIFAISGLEAIGRIVVY